MGLRFVCMSARKVMPFWAAILIVLFAANLVWMSWRLYEYGAFSEDVRQLKIEAVRTDELSGIGLFVAKTREPIWTKVREHGRPIVEKHFFGGKNVLDINLRSNRPPVFSVYFYGQGKSVTWWTDRGGSGSFTEKIHYDTNGILSRHEAWLDRSWILMDRRNGKNGVVINGEWRRIKFDTNGLWGVDNE